MDVPVLNTRPAGGVMPYAEGPDIGYRAWVRADRHPAYWFGHGLGYTSWRYERLDAPAAVNAGEDLVVRVRVANAGRRLGKEVVQVYLSRPGSAIRRPPVWLAGFTVLNAGPGTVSEVQVRIDARAFQHWSVDQGGWRAEPGVFHLSAGRSVGDRPLAGDVTVRVADQISGRMVVPTT